MQQSKVYVPYYMWSGKECSMNMKEKSIVEKLIDHTPLALIVIGVVILIIGAAGGWPNPTLQVKEAGWRVVLGIIGAMIVGIGGLLLWSERVVKSHDDPRSVASTDYGIKIVSPQEGAPGEEHVKVSGTYDTKPPEGSIWLFNISPDGRNYLPQGPITQFDPMKKVWTGDSYIVSDTVVMVAKVGKSGCILCDYYSKVVRKTGLWFSLEKLTEDIEECDRVWIRKLTSEKRSDTEMTKKRDSGQIEIEKLESKLKQKGMTLPDVSKDTRNLPAYRSWLLEGLGG